MMGVVEYGVVGDGAADGRFTNGHRVQWVLRMMVIYDDVVADDRATGDRVTDDGSADNGAAHNEFCCQWRC